MQNLLFAALNSRGFVGANSTESQIPDDVKHFKFDISSHDLV